MTCLGTLTPVEDAVGNYFCFVDGFVLAVRECTDGMIELECYG